MCGTGNASDQSLYTYVVQLFKIKVLCFFKNNPGTFIMLFLHREEEPTLPQDCQVVVDLKMVLLCNHVACLPGESRKSVA